MDFTIPKTHQLFHRMVQEFAEQEVRPVAKQVDVQGWPDMNVVRKLGENGLLGVPFPAEIRRRGPGRAGLLPADGNHGRCLHQHGHHDRRAHRHRRHVDLPGRQRGAEAKYLPDLATGKKIAAFCLTEPGAGSDAAAIKTRAIREGDKYILSGAKIYITNGPIAETFTVLAVTDPALGARGGVTAFIVENGTPGLAVGTIEHKMGIHGSATSEIVLDEVVVPSANVLGQVGAGFITFMASLDTGRLGLGAACLGGAQAALDYMCRYAAGRSQFGKAIGEKQAIQWIIANTATEVEALRSLVYRTAWMVDTGQPYSREGAMCKLLGSELASRAVDRALQIHGALGYNRDFPLERTWRDARIAEIFEGTNEIQRIVIAGQVLRPYGVRVSS